VFVDAVMAGAPIVCVADTAIARALEGNGIAALGAEGLADAIVASRIRYAEFSDAAVRARDRMNAAIRAGPLVTALNGPAL
jgi:hypothetical protein